MPPKPRPHLEGLHQYSPGKPISELQREKGLKKVVKLASNENPLGPSPKAVEAIRAAAASVSLYPDMSCRELVETLSTKFGVDKQCVLVSNGSDELIHLLSCLVVDRGDEVVVGNPSFSRYMAEAQLADANVVSVPLDASLKHDLSAMGDAITPKTRIVWIANPNNPTGTIVSKSEVDRLLDRVPENVLVVLDEAYFEYVTRDDYPNGRDYVVDRDNVVVLRTLSKTYGLAGLRIGYGFAPVQIAKAIRPICQPFSVNRLAQIAAVAALSDEAYIRESVQWNATGLKLIADILQDAGAKTSESHANFVWADFGYDTTSLVEALLNLGVIVRSGAIFGAKTAIRVSVGTAEEIDFFGTALRECLIPGQTGA